MKLFLIGDFPNDDKTYTGVQGVLVNLVNELIKRDDIQLVIISLSEECDLKRFEDKSKIYKLRFRSSFLKARKRFNEIVRAEKPDIIHLQDVVPGILLYKNEYNSIFIVTQHAVLKEELLWQVTLRKKLLFKVKQFIENHYFKKIRNIIFISRYNKEVYFENNEKISKLNFQLIPNPVNDVFFNNIAPVISEKENHLYFVGEIKKRKGLHVLIQALSKLEQQGLQCKLHVIGGFKEAKYEKEIFQMINSLNLTKNIIFCGWKSQLEILDYSKDIPVFVLPSFQETLPLSIAEAMCQGKVVVATNICGIPEMIEDGVTGYLLPRGDSKQLAVVLSKIFKNVAHQKEISSKAILKSKRFDSRTIVNETISFYQNILSENS